MSITTRHMVKAVSALLLLVFKRLPRYSKGEMADGQEWVWPKWIRYSFGVSDGLQVFFNTGLLGAIITTIFSSLIWRVVASDFPILFLNNFGALAIFRLCLLLEMSGICSSAWICARLHNVVAKSARLKVFTNELWR